MSGNMVGIVGRKEGKKQVPTNQLGNREESPPGIRSLEGSSGCQGAKRLFWPPPQVPPWVGEGAPLSGASPSDPELPRFMPNPADELGDGNCPPAFC